MNFVSALRNAAPALLDVAEAAREVWSRGDSGFHDDAWCLVPREALDKLRAALARLEEE